MATTQKRRSSSKKSSGRSTSSKNSRANSEQTDRYRRAAEDALQQLDWAIGFLHGIKKTEVSKALAKNRSYIRKQLMGEPEEALPTEQTSET